MAEQITGLDFLRVAKVLVLTAGDRQVTEFVTQLSMANARYADLVRMYAPARFSEMIREAEEDENCKFRMEREGKAALAHYQTGIDFEIFHLQAAWVIEALVKVFAARGIRTSEQARQLIDSVPINQFKKDIGECDKEQLAQMIIQHLSHPPQPLTVSDETLRQLREIAARFGMDVVPRS